MYVAEKDGKLASFEGETEESPRENITPK